MADKLHSDDRNPAYAARSGGPPTRGGTWDGGDSYSFVLGDGVSVIRVEAGNYEVARNRAIVGGWVPPEVAGDSPTATSRAGASTAPAGGTQAPSPALEAIMGALPPALTAPIAVAGQQIPVWAIGAAVIAFLVLTGRR